MSRLGALALIVWIALGARLLLEATTPERESLPPAVPLAEFPADVFGPGWTSEDLDISAKALQIAGVSDHVYRRHSAGARSLDLWVGYVTGGASGVHYPGICFPYQGMKLENSDTVTVPGTGLAPDPVFYETHWTVGSRHVYCLYSFYYLGHFAPEVAKLRLADLTERPRYHAIVVLSGDFEGSLESTREIYFGALGKILPPLVEHFPPDGDAPPDESPATPTDTPD